MRPSDAVARLGGDEFAVALAGVRDLAHAQAVGDKIVAMAGLPFRVPPAITVMIGASVGVAFKGETETGWQDLIERADQGLYRAKNDGRGRRSS